MSASKNSNKPDEITAKAVAYYSVFFAVTLVLGMIERLFVFPVPGLKIGLANSVILFIMLAFSKKVAIIISVMRILVGSLIFGSFLGTGFFVGLGGALASFLVMAALMTITKKHIVIIGIAGAIAHSIAQIAVACLLLRSASIMYYLPILLLCCVPCGAIVGRVATVLVGRFKSGY